ncbi:MAG TPA: sugar porter family MFS transporter [Verrucomicrobiota bacterium]|nr:MFS transporter [Verrucomicrobiales bacterium]HRI11454.1 sugar porter family MFS transporter [Verrucomicrobiota bacterium]
MPQVANVRFVVLIATVAALGGFLFGFDTACINGAISALRQHFQAGPVLVGLSVSLALVGSAVGALLAGAVSDRYGRIRAMLIAAILFTISAIGSGLPITIWDFIFWRVLGGIGVGLASAVAPSYIAEVAPPEFRGRLGSLQQLAIVIGIFVALMTNYVIVRQAGSASSPWWLGATAWRWMFWAEIPAALLYGIGAMLIPESPRYLVRTGRHEEAQSILERILGSGAKATLGEIRKTLRKEHPPRFSDLRSAATGLLPIVWVGMALSIFQQFVGINVIFYYSSVLWESVGFGEEKALYVSMITGAINIGTTLVAIALIDRWGRRPLLLFGSAGMAVSLVTMAWCFGSASVGPDGAPHLTSGAGHTALVAANTYVFFFGCSWGPVVWVLLGEMFNNQIRAAALSLCAAIQWVANFIVSTTFPPLLQGIGLWAAYGIYALFAILSFGFVWRSVKETKGRTLESM